MSQLKNRLNGTVFYTAAFIIVSFSLFSMLFNERMSTMLDGVLAWVGTYFGGYYFLVAGLFVVFVLGLAGSRYGNIKLGAAHAVPEFSLLSWSAMLFAAGIGIDLMFFSVAEPIMQYMMPPVGDGQNVAAARQALVWTIFHYGLTGWCMYALLGVALGYFAYRYHLPLSIRSVLYPVLGKRMQGWLGHGVDVAAILGTIFGIATTCGIGVVQLNYGLHVVFATPEGLTWQLIIIAVAVFITLLSATTGASKGIKLLSELNIYFALGLIVFIFAAGNKPFLINALVSNIGDYLSRFPAMMLDTFAYEQGDFPKQWIQDWTLFFWAWWIAWSPFVGLFLAKISKGRTIRQFIFGTLSIPFCFTLVWLSVMGNSALYQVLQGHTAFAQQVINRPEIGFYELLTFYPAFSWTAVLALISGLLFYVTSADSGAIVLSNFSYANTDSNDTPAVWIRIFWAWAIGLLTAAMLITDGIHALQKATIIMGLPFSFVMIAVMIALTKALRLEDLRTVSRQLATPVPDNASATHWPERLARITTYPNQIQTLTMLDGVCQQAMQEVANALSNKGLSTQLQRITAACAPLYSWELTVIYEKEFAFVYTICPVAYNTPKRPTVPEGQDIYYRLEVQLLDGLQSNDLSGYSKEQLINDILDQYERHCRFLHLNSQSGNELYLP